MLTTGSLPALTMTGRWYKSWAFVPKRGIHFDALWLRLVRPADAAFHDSGLCRLPELKAR